MQFESASGVPNGTSVATEVCIIGAGAAGIALARELDGSGIDVVLLEAGGLRRDVDLEARAFAVTQRGMPLRSPLPDRGRWFGGSTNLWSGRIAKPAPIDFETRSWVPQSGWPLLQSDLEPYFDRAAALLDVPNFDHIEINSWEPNPTTATFASGGQTDLGVFLWANGMRMASRSGPSLQTSQNVRVLTDATSTELLENEDGTAITAVRVVAPGGSRFAVHATTFVLAAGSIENPRLMLASTNRSADGVGNAYDQVGRYYMDHPRGEGLATVDLRPLSDAQLQRLALLGQKSKTAYGDAQLHVRFSEQLQREEGLLNHALHAHLSYGVPQRGHASVRRLIQRATGKKLDTGPSLAWDLRDLLRTSPQLARYAARRLVKGLRPVQLVVIDQMEQEPDPESRLTIDRSRLDEFGIPYTEVNWRIGESTYRSQRRMHEIVRGILHEHGIDGFRSRVLTSPLGDVKLWDMKHPSGTTRMSASPRSGVVSPDSRVHGVENLYVAGSSVFPTVGYFNPVLTIVALTLRLADEIRRVHTRRVVVSTSSGTTGR